MIGAVPIPGGLAWPLLIAIAWLAGELAHLWRLPRISGYGVAGFLLAPTQLGLLPADAGTGAALLAHIAFGIVLFEFGYRINLRWLKTNRWLAATAVVEAGVTFAAILLVVLWWGGSALTALLLASLCMSTSPAAVLRVVNEQRASGQVSERILHLTAVNAVLGVLCFKVILGFWTFETSGNLLQAASNSILVLAASAGLGGLFGIAVPALLRWRPDPTRDATVAFAVAVVLLVALCHALKVSAVLGTLAFGLVARHHRVALDRTQRNFGALGDLLAVILFTHVATTIAWPRVMAGLGLGIVLVLVRAAAKVAVVAAFARASGTSPGKGVLTGIGLMPISVFVILLLEQTRALGIDLLDLLAPLAPATLVLELLGPVATQFALRRAGEAGETEGGRHAA